MTALIPSIVALGLVVGFVTLGEVIRIRTPGLRKLFLPGAVLGGILGLVAGPQLLGWDRFLSLPGQSSPEVYSLLSRFPGLFINLVFAALMLGRRLDTVPVIWKRARPQIVMGHLYAWGQYVVGFILTLVLIVPLFEGSLFSAPVIAIGFQGGHGTAAGLEETFRSFGFSDGRTVAYAVATFGIVMGAVLGPLLATILSRRHPVEDGQGPDSKKVCGGNREESGEKDSVELSPLTGTLTVHLGLLGLVILVGWLLLQGAMIVEEKLQGGGDGLLVTSYIPLFSVVLLVGLGTQWLLQKTSFRGVFQRSLFEKISSFGLDMVVASALATLSLAVAGEHGWVILTLCLGGVAWNLSVFFFFGPKIYPRPWHPYGLGDLGGGTATTATGLLLIRVADPGRKTCARQAYVEKQPFYEPFMGGGLVTAFALPVTAALGGGVCLGLTSMILLAWLGYAVKLSRVGPTDEDDREKG